MKVTIAAVGHRGGGRKDGFHTLAGVYLNRVAQYTAVEAKMFRSEAAFWEAIEGLRARTAPVVVLLDERGKMFSSEEFAGWVGRQRDGGTQNLVFGVGPADGWSEATRERAGLLLSLGKMTLPHELARVVLAEQVYRGFSILAGHPYHRE